MTRLRVLALLLNCATIGLALLLMVGVILWTGEWIGAWAFLLGAIIFPLICLALRPAKRGLVRWLAPVPFPECDGNARFQRTHESSQSVDIVLRCSACGETWEAFGWSSGGGSSGAIG